MTGKSTTGFWIFESSLISTLTILSHLVKYHCSHDEIEMIKYGLSSTSDEKSIWFNHHFKGERLIEMKLSRDSDNSDIIFFEICSEEITSSEIDLVVYIAENYNLQQK